jgi:hypothetical protein
MARNDGYDSHYYEQIGEIEDEREPKVREENPDFGDLTTEKVIFFDTAEQDAWGSAS